MFHYRNNQTKSRKNRFSPNRCANLLEQRTVPSICSFKDKYIIASGGHLSSSVEYYSIRENTWTKLSDMNVKRSNHASCALGTYVYAFCGFNHMITAFTKIERINF